MRKINEKNQWKNQWKKINWRNYNQEVIKRASTTLCFSKEFKGNGYSQKKNLKKRRGSLLSLILLLSHMSHMSHMTQ